MKVNMSMLSDEQEKAVDPVRKIDTEKEADVPADSNDEDESGNHSKIKTVFLIVAMVGGFALAAWSLTELVNNMRLNEQKAPAGYSYEFDIGNYQGPADEESGAISVDELEQYEEPANTVRDGPGDSPGDSENGMENDVQYLSTDEQNKAIQDALNEAALDRQKLKISEEMLDNVLQQLDEKENELNALKAGN